MIERGGMELVVSRDFEGETAVHKACLRGHVEIVKSLVKVFPTAVTLVTNKGKSPIDYALEAGHKEVLAVILDTCSTSL